MSAVAATASISGVNNISLTVFPSGTSPSIASGSIQFSYSIKDASDFRISFSSATVSTDMTDGSGGAEYINSISTNDILDNFNTNRWGVCVASSACNNTDSFEPISSIANPRVIVSGNLANTANHFRANGSKTITYGIKADPGLQAGTYTNTQVISLTATDRPSILGDATYMQDVSAQMCANTPTPDASEKTSVFTFQLHDRRDNNKYWVAKLADGHCWMTQNLALNLLTSQTLTPNDSNVLRNWTPSANTTSVITNITDLNSEQSWNFGMYVLNSPYSGISLCPSWSANLQSCPGFSGLARVGAGTSYTDSYDSIREDSIQSNYVPYNTTEGKFDSHFLIGNYYTWNAALAGHGTSQVYNGNEIYGSICPKGWVLPSARNSTISSVVHLMNSYFGTSWQRQATAGVAKTAASAPLYLQPTGHFNPASGMAQVGALGDIGLELHSPIRFEHMNLYLILLMILAI